MKCPFCGESDTQVKDSRQSYDGKTIKRRRFCSNCQSRFTTYERLETRDIAVIKKDNTRRPFDREKLFRSINIATRKRAINSETIENIIDNIVNKIEKSGDSEITSKEIGELVIKALAELDEVAYVRFASVYHDFTNVTDFENFLHSISKNKPIKA